MLEILFFLYFFFFFIPLDPARTRAYTPTCTAPQRGLRACRCERYRQPGAWGIRASNRASVSLRSPPPTPPCNICSFYRKKLSIVGRIYSSFEWDDRSAGMGSHFCNGVPVLASLAPTRPPPGNVRSVNLTLGHVGWRLFGDISTWNICQAGQAKGPRAMQLANSHYPHPKQAKARWAMFWKAVWLGGKNGRNAERKSIPLSFSCHLQPPFVAGEKTKITHLSMGGAIAAP